MILPTHSFLAREVTHSLPTDPFRPIVTFLTCSDLFLTHHDMFPNQSDLCPVYSDLAIPM